MEILRNGKGDSIGKGSQRTTRDVRNYEWNNLTITDVPGICAFEGKEDEKKAIESAKKADLIVFLLTDDAPQPEEAKFFQTIIEIGKPVIGIINVKCTIDENKDLLRNFRIIEHDINKVFNINRLNIIKNQFCEYSAQSGQEWSKIPFVYLHLKAAFLSQSLLKSKKIDQELAFKLRKISQIDKFKDIVIKQVKQKGEFYRMKKFVDTILLPMLESMDLLINWSYNNYKNGKIIYNKKEKLKIWLKDFEEYGNNEIDNSIGKIRSRLNREADIFVEDNFKEKNEQVISNRWNKILENIKIDTDCSNTLKGLDNECKLKLTDIAKEFENEFVFNMSISKRYSFYNPNFQDKKRIWNWTGISLGATTGIVGTLATFGVCGLSTVLAPWLLGASAIIGVATWLGSFLFKNREKAEREAKDNLHNQLKNKIEKICSEYREKMKSEFGKVIQKVKDIYIKELDSLYIIILDLVELQKSLVWKINSHILEINKSLIIEVIKLVGAEDIQFHLKEIARIPGNICILNLSKDGLFSKDEKKYIRNLMGETVYFINNYDDKDKLISKIIKIRNKNKTFYKQRYDIQKKDGFLYIDLDNNIDSNDEKLLSNRIKLSQQLTGFIIRKKIGG